MPQTAPSPASPPRLAVENLAKTFAGQTAVAGVSFEIAPGEVLCLLGPSGCGKSTTLRIVAGVERQSSGAVRLDGRVVSEGPRHDPPEARGVGLMFQDFALFPHLTLAENVAFGLRALERSQRRPEAISFLERVNLAQAADKYPHQLSGGEQQRVALARALAPRPRAMLMDEPFSGLDHRLRDEMRDGALSLLKEAGAAVVLVTHDPAEALRMADRIALMRAGRIIQIGTPYFLYSRPVDRAAAAFFSDINVLPARAQGRRIETPFGLFLAPALEDGAPVELVMRPEHLRLTLDRGNGPPPAAAPGELAAHGVVERARFMGPESLVEARMDAGGARLRASAPGLFTPDAGTPVWISARRDLCMIFPADGA